MGNHFKIRIEYLIKGFSEEVIVFEENQYSQVDKDTQSNHEFLEQSTFSPEYGKSQKIIGDYRKKQDEEKQSSCFIVKEQTDHKQINIPPGILFIYIGIAEKYCYKKYPEIQPGEYQRMILIKKQYALQQFH